MAPCMGYCLRLMLASCSTCYASLSMDFMFYGTARWLLTAAPVMLQSTLNEVKAERAERSRLGAAPNYQRTLP